MADNRFANLSQIDIKNLKEKAANPNTSKSTHTWISVWRNWANVRGVDPNIETYEPEALDAVLQRFYAEVRNKNGENYEPESLKVMLASLDRYLREKQYKYSIIRDRQFSQSKNILDGKAKILREQGKGKRPNASNALTAEEEEILWESGKLGSGSPRVLSQTMWWLLTQHFGLRGRQEHHSMAVDDFQICKDDHGIEYIIFKENPTKTRQGGLNTKRRQVFPKMFATGGQRCPFALFKEYLSRRPIEIRETGPFYLAVIDNPKSQVWYKKQPLGIHSIDRMMQAIVKDTALADSGKKLTNHSARKTVVKKLRAANVERQSIIQVTGHASEQSLCDYDEGNEQEQRALSTIISNQQLSKEPESSGQLAFQQFPKEPCSAVSTAWQPSLAKKVNNFHNCQVTFNMYQGFSDRPSKHFKRIKKIDSD